MLRCCATPSISVRRGWTQVLIGWAGFAIAKPAPQGTETMLIKMWGEKSKKALALPSVRLQLALTQSCDWTEIEKLIKTNNKTCCWQFTFFTTNLIAKQLTFQHSSNLPKSLRAAGQKTNKTHFYVKFCHTDKQASVLWCHFWQRDEEAWLKMAIFKVC